MHDDFDLIIKSQEETATIQEVEKNLSIRFKHVRDKITSTVKANDLKIDHSYQRVPSQAKIDKIIKNFNSSAIGVVTLSIRENNDLYIIDGQHRVEALKKMGLGDRDLNAIVLFNLTVAQEAELFVTMNDSRTKPKRGDIYRASVKAGDSVSVEIQSVFDKFGLKVAEKPGYKIIRAIGTVHKVYSRIGVNKLEEVLSLLIEANGDHSTSFQAEYIEAVSCLVVQFKDLDKKRLSQAINGIGDPALAVLKASSIATTSKPIDKTLSLASMILDKYNYRLTKHRLDRAKVFSLDARNYLENKEA